MHAIFKEKCFWWVVCFTRLMLLVCKKVIFDNTIAAKNNYKSYQQNTD